jgi:hypothetical protein
LPLADETGLSEEQGKLRPPDLEFVDSREKYERHVVAARTIRTAQPPALAHDPAGPVSLHGSTIRTDRYKNDPIVR